MIDENLVRFPAGPGQFLSMLERVEQLRHWSIRHYPYGDMAITGFAIDLPGIAALLVYSDLRMPIVKLGDKITFDLMRLFDPGEAWDPKIYTPNPFMPLQFKDFLNQLFAVLLKDRDMRARTMALAA